MTSRPLEPGVFTATFAKAAAKARLTGQAALTSLAIAVERQAKTDLARAEHPYGTPTPAKRGGPPALISGNLRRAVTHSKPTPYPTGWEIRVGVARGFFPKYPGRPTSKTEAARYGRYLEEGLRNGAKYPWLVPAFEAVIRQVGGGQLGRWLSSDWRRI